MESFYKVKIGLSDDEIEYLLANDIRRVRDELEVVPSDRAARPRLVHVVLVLALDVVDVVEHLGARAVARAAAHQHRDDDAELEDHQHSQAQDGADCGGRGALGRRPRSPRRQFRYDQARGQAGRPTRGDGADQGHRHRQGYLAPSDAQRNP